MTDLQVLTIALSVVLPLSLYIPERPGEGLRGGVLRGKGVTPHAMKSRFDRIEATMTAHMLKHHK